METFAEKGLSTRKQICKLVLVSAVLLIRNVPDSSILLGEAEMNVQSLEIGIEEGWRAYDLMKKEEEGTPLEDDVREELLKIMEIING